MSSALPVHHPAESRSQHKPTAVQTSTGVIKQFPPKSQQLVAAERTSVSVELSRSGSAVMVSECGSGGASVPKRIIDGAEFPYFADMRLRDGSWVTVEVRRYSPSQLPADFDEDAALLPSSEVVFKPLRTRCDLLNFSEE